MEGGEGDEAQRSLAPQSKAPASGGVKGWSGPLAAAGRDEISGSDLRRSVCAVGVCVCLCIKVCALPSRAAEGRLPQCLMQLWGSSSCLGFHRSQHRATICQEGGGQGEDRQTRWHQGFNQTVLEILFLRECPRRIWKQFVRDSNRSVHHSPHLEQKQSCYSN